MTTLQRQLPSRSSWIRQAVFTCTLLAPLLPLTPILAKQPLKLHRSNAPAEFQDSRADALGPMVTSTETAQGAMLLRFSQSEDGLILKGSGRGAFQIAGADHIWFPAEAHLVNGVVVVSTSLVQQPVSVRYNWSSVATAALFNHAGVPAPPFHIDK